MKENKMTKALRLYGLAAASYALVATVCLQFPIYEDPEAYSRVQFFVFLIGLSGLIAMLLAYRGTQT